MPYATTQSMTTADDATLIEMIRSARRRLVVLAPALSTPVAIVLSNRWREMGADAVTVVLDMDAEVFRLGLGDFESMAYLNDAARDVGSLVGTQPGVRIAVIISDEETLIFAPQSKLIEASTPGPTPGPGSAPAPGSSAPGENAPAGSSGGNSNAKTQSDPDFLGHDGPAAPPPKPNAIRLSVAPADIERDLGAGPDGAMGRTIGLDNAQPATLLAVETDLQNNPPRKFDVVHTLNVFNAFFEFVELEITGLHLNRRSIRLPDELIPLADKATRDRLKTSFTPLTETKVSTRWFDLMRQELSLKYIRHIKGYGAVIRRADKEAFQLEVADLKKLAEEFSEKVGQSVTDELTSSRNKLVAAFLPLVLANPPQAWRSPFTSAPPKPEDIQSLLESRLDRAFHPLGHNLGKITVSAAFKAVTYESLSDKDFVDAAREALPDMPNLHGEAIAALANAGSIYAQQT
ncbi:MAG: hypothetical protein K8S99_08485 [Planctomycetes bacterium]|nr:hypothetical protein [Planctomycetota bacterium]